MMAIIAILSLFCGLGIRANHVLLHSTHGCRLKTTGISECQGTLQSLIGDGEPRREFAARLCLVGSVS